MTVSVPYGPDPTYMTTWSTCVVRVEVVIEEEVTRLERIEGDMGERGPLDFGRPRDGDAGLRPGPLHQARTVETL